MRFLQIIRWKNLLLIALIQVLVKYYLIPLFDLQPILTNFQFVLIVFATVLIALGGNIINDIYDLEIDRINKPERVWISKLISIKQAKITYLIISFLGLLFGGLVSIQLGKTLFIVFFLIPIFALYLYASYFKKLLLIDNIFVATLIALSIIIIAVFEQVLFKGSIVNSLGISEVIWGLVFFAFFLNLVREIIKDIEDSIGDKAFGVVSFPIKFGNEITHILIKGIVGILIGVLIAIAIVWYKKEPFLAGYLVLAVITSLFLFVSQLNKVKTTTDYKKLSTLLKLIMLVGILSVFMINTI
ncbi:MAG TPA: hypothetical protein EYG92_04450 [Lutibacter sp.]|nr:hypothetical protein [Lutibacter sp.]